MLSLFNRIQQLAGQAGQGSPLEMAQNFVSGLQKFAEQGSFMKILEEDTETSGEAKLNGSHHMVEDLYGLQQYNPVAGDYNSDNDNRGYTITRKYDDDDNYDNYDDYDDNIVTYDGETWVAPDSIYQNSDWNNSNFSGGDVTRKYDNDDNYDDNYYGDNGDNYNDNNDEGDNNNNKNDDEDNWNNNNDDDDNYYGDNDDEGDNNNNNNDNYDNNNNLNDDNWNNNNDNNWNTDIQLNVQIHSDTNPEGHDEIYVRELQIQPSFLSDLIVVRPLDRPLEDGDPYDDSMQLAAIYGVYIPQEQSDLLNVHVTTSIP